MDKDRDRSPYLNTVQAAHYLNISPKTLEKMRVVGGGPNFRKHGGRVVYTRPDLDLWSERHKQDITHSPQLPHDPHDDDPTDPTTPPRSQTSCPEPSL